MNFTNSQRKYIKRNVKKLSLEEVSNNLNISEEEILNYLEKKWSKHKYEKYIEENVEEKDSFIKTKEKLSFLSFFKKYWYVFIFLAILVFACYINSLNNEFVSDDIDGILKNRNIGNFQVAISNPLFAIRPVFYFVIYKLVGLAPIYFRLLNIFFHIGVVFTVFILLYYMQGLVVAFFASSLVAVHPILIESVAWISGGPYVQSAFFLLLSFFFYLYCRNKKIGKWYIFSFFLFLLGLSSMNKAVAFPFVLIVYEISQSTFKRNWKRILPFFTVLVVGGIYFASMIGDRISFLSAANYRDVGRDNPFIQVPISITSYLGLMFWPDKLTLYHSELNFTLTEYYIRLFFFLVFIVIIVFTWFKHRKISFWLLFFIIILLPVLTPLRIAWVVAERYVYLGAIGIFVVVAIVLEKISNIKKIRPFVFIFFSIIIVALMIRTIYRNIDWKNQDNLWIATSETSPSDPKTHNNLGDVYGRHGDLKRAAEEFKRAIELNPKYAEAHHNLANIYARMGRFEEAIETYNIALKYNPDLWQSYQTMGIVYFNMDDLEKAEENLKKSIEMNPQNAESYSNLGFIYFKQEKKKKAKQEFNKALKIDPNNEGAKNGLILLKQ